jgi:starvation-inducible outer membrane lipoprotein
MKKKLVLSAALISLVILSILAGCSTVPKKMPVFKQKSLT